VEEGLTLWGKSLTLNAQTGPKGIEIDSGRVCISTPSKESALAFLKKSLRQALREAIKTIAKPFCEQLRTNYQTLTIRSQRTKCASCSRGNTLNFNIRCAFLPIPHLKYLVGHEIAHLLEPSHNENFWELVETLVQDTEKKRGELQGFWYALHHNPLWQKLLEI
jgi:predicted metal-dependent hydrolase